MVSHEASRLSAPTSPLSVLVVGDEAIGILVRDGGEAHRVGMAGHRTERRLAENAATALGLQLAAVDIDTSGTRPVVSNVSARPAFNQFERSANIDVAAAIIAAVEARLQVPRRLRSSLAEDD